MTSPKGHDNHNIDSKNIGPLRHTARKRVGGRPYTIRRPAAVRDFPNSFSDATASFNADPSNRAAAMETEIVPPTIIISDDDADGDNNHANSAPSSPHYSPDTPPPVSTSR
ncbi:hypothetical protein MKX03_002984 [Papaver bracteatum]|nr:hypothetical protein MKX03_002984 [Papaver bracteatum]